MSLVIPHVYEPRPDTGLTNAKLGIWFFLASEIMLFGALFSSYVFLRAGAVDWQRFAYARTDPAAIHETHGDESAADHAEAGAYEAPAAGSREAVGSPLESSVPLATVNTIVLITSSITMVLAWASLVLKNVGKFRINMSLTILLSGVFLVIKFFEYRAKIGHGLVPGFSPLLALYWTMTGLHVAHVLGGIVVNGYLLGPGSKMWKSNETQFTGRVEVAGLYWHFVDLVWIFLFPTLYLM